MTDNEVRILMDKVNAMLVSQAEIWAELKAIRAENNDGKDDHNDYEARLRRLEVVDPRDIERRIRGLERTRWSIAGVATTAGAGIGFILAVLTR